MYAKLIDGALHIAPNKLIVDDTQVWNASASEYLAQGWKEVVFTEQPENPPTGYYYESGWEDRTDVIVQTWTLAELPDDIGDEEAFSIIFGEEL